MTTIWLVRHGEAEASWSEHPDPGLSALGHSQAAASAQLLEAQAPADAVLLTSPKRRAKETAEACARLRGAAVIEAPAFIEIKAPVPLSERQDWLRAFMGSDWSNQPAELWAWRQHIADSLKALEQPTVIFTHFLVINTVHALCTGHSATLQLWPANASVHRISTDGAGLRWDATGELMQTAVL